MIDPSITHMKETIISFFKKSSCHNNFSFSSSFGDIYTLTPIINNNFLDYLISTDTPQMILLGVLLASDPDNVDSLFNYMFEFLINPNFDKLNIDDSIKFQYLMRLVNASIHDKMTENLYYSDFLQNYYNLDHSFFYPPYAFLCDAIGVPLNVPIPKLHKNRRIAGMTLFYGGVNYLNSRNFQKAYITLMQAIQFLSNIPEFSDSFIRKYSLAAFLNHVPKNIFLNDKTVGFFFPNDVNYLWSSNDIPMKLLEHLENPQTCQDNHLYYKEFHHEIEREQIRRLIIMYSISVSRIKIKDLAQLLNNPIDMIDMILNELSSDGTIVFEKSNDIITFTEPPIEPLIDSHLKEMSELTPMLKNL